MKIQQLLEHHNISRNPFADEDAQTDRVFKDFCIDGTFHPTWDKVYGDPAEPATSVVFGEKGSGKTAMRLQIAQHLQEYNQANSDKRLLVIHYDDFNHFLDRFRDHFGSRKRIDRVLSSWRLWDHMDAILSIGVTGIVDRILEVKQPSPAVEGELNQSDVDQLDHHQARDLLLLAACYDQSTAETFKGRWHRLRRRLRFGNLKNHWDLALGIASSVTIVATLIALAVNSQWDMVKWFWLWIPLLVAGWAPRLWRMWKNLLRALRIKRKLRVCDREVNPLRQIFMNFSIQRANRPTVARQRPHGRSLRVVLQIPRPAADSSVFRCDCLGRPNRRAAFDQRIRRLDESVDLADPRQQVPQASGAGAQADASDRVDSLHREGRSPVLSAGSLGQAEHGVFISMDSGSAV